MNEEQLKEFVDGQVESSVELLFMNAHGAAMTTSGDITPMQQIKLDQIKEDLKNLIVEQVIQNK